MRSRTADADIFQASEKFLLFRSIQFLGRFFIFHEFLISFFVTDFACITNCHALVIYIDHSRTMDDSYVISALRALGDPTRFRVMCLLAKAKRGMAAGEISSTLQVRQNTLSSHMSIMARCGLLVVTRQGRNIIYTADTRTARDITTQLFISICDVPQIGAAKLMKE